MCDDGVSDKGHSNMNAALFWGLNGRMAQNFTFDDGVSSLRPARYRLEYA